MALRQALSEVVNLIYPVNTPTQLKQRSSQTPAEREKMVQERTAALLETNLILKDQLAACQSSRATLQKVYDDLEMQLQERTVEIAKLNLLLQKQTKKHKQVLMREREQHALNEALRDTVATMSSTLDLDKVLDHILDTIGRFTPYDGANVLFVESDLVHVVRQRGYVEKTPKRIGYSSGFPLLNWPFCNK